jgi:homogentisate 1,2-dioxygenase
LVDSSSLFYQSGFGNEFESEALVGALPQGRNSPQRCPYGLYAEQVSGSAFTAPRHENRRSWLYRIRPSVKHINGFTAYQVPNWKSAPLIDSSGFSLGPLRWGAPAFPIGDVDWISGIRTMTTAGDVHTQVGFANHFYFINQSMSHSTHKGRFIWNADAEMLCVPQDGGLRFTTEFGILDVHPGEIIVIPRGILYCVDLLDSTSSARGYICENYGALFTLPPRGVIGSNSLAHERDFISPVAHFFDEDHPECEYTVVVKWGGGFYQTQLKHHPIDVVAWHGNYVPYKYDLNRFATLGSISFDHPDPSIFTVLTSPSAVEGTANVDFVLFPDRWLVGENTFRPPWYHRNIMSECMGLIYGQYDAKEEGFVPGGMSVHNMMLPHGPDAFGFKKASKVELTPQKLSGTLAFMFESRYPQHVTPYGQHLECYQSQYTQCWFGLEKRFNGHL